MTPGSNYRIIRGVSSAGIARHVAFIVVIATSSLFTATIFSQSQTQLEDYLALLAEPGPGPAMNTSFQSSMAVISGPSTHCTLNPPITLTETGGMGTAWLWNTSETTQSITINPQVTTQYSVTVTTASGPQVATKIVTVHQSPGNVTASAFPNPVCANTMFGLTSTYTQSSVILSQNFETGLGDWTTENLTTGGMPELTAWTIQDHGYTYLGETFYSPGDTKFILSNADAGQSGTNVHTLLTSPSFSTVGLPTLELNFRQYYRNLQGLAEAFVEISTDNTNWQTVITFNSDHGAAGGFETTTVPLDTYIGHSAVKIRFRYQGGWTWYWAIDDVIVSGGSGIPSFLWSSQPPGFSSILQNPIMVTQSIPTEYFVTVTNTAGCSITATTGVVGVITGSNPGTVSGPATMCVNESAQFTSSGDPGGIWSSSSPTVASVNSVTGMVNSLSPGTTEIRYTVTSSCGAVMAFKALTVKPTVVQNTQNDGPGSLRDVISCAQGGETITFNLPLGQTIALTSGEIILGKNLTINGPGYTGLSISGNNTSRIFRILPGKTVSIKNITLKNATAPSNGGAIFSEGTLILENVQLQSNFQNGLPKALTIAPGMILNFQGNTFIRQ